MPPDKSLRRKLARVRPPKVHITYDREMIGGVIKEELPFVVGVLADLAGHPDPAVGPPPGLESAQRQFVDIHRDNFDQVMSAIAPRLALRVPDALRKDGSEIVVELHFRGIEDFEPVNVVRQVGPLRELLESRRRTAEPRTECAGDDKPKDSNRIAELDRLLSDQLNAIMHDPGFQKLEASWRGLHRLVFWSETSEVLRIRVLSTRKDELLCDMEGAPEIDRCALYRKVYTEVFEGPGGLPFGVLIGDFEFGRDPRDVGFLKRISYIAAAAHAPFLASASPRLFGLERFAELADGPRDLESIFRGPEYDGWKGFRDSEDSRYVALCLPRILLRDPYGEYGRSVEEFGFEEDLSRPRLESFLWGNAAYVLGNVITDAFAKYGCCEKISGVEGGGLVEGLPHFIFRTHGGDLLLQCSTEIAISCRREGELTRLGLMPLVHLGDSHGRAAFLSTASCHEPRLYLESAVAARADLSARLEVVLATSRFAHYLGVIGRELIDPSMSLEECEERLNGWIRRYVNRTGEGPLDRWFPLEEALVRVEDDPSRPGGHLAIARLRTHGMAALHPGGSIQLVLELTGAARTPPFSNRPRP